MNNQKILFVLTNHAHLAPTNNPSANKTGFHLAEAARPWAVLTEAGYAIDLASPKGGKAPIDPSSRDLDDEVNARFMSDANMAAQIDNTHALKDVQLGDYAAIYFPGGHGTMWDFPESDDIQSAIRTMYEDGKVVAAVCHGPAAFVNVKLSDGSWFVNGEMLSALTYGEERASEALW